MAKLRSNFILLPWELHIYQEKGSWACAEGAEITRPDCPATLLPSLAFFKW